MSTIITSIICSLILNIRIYLSIKSLINNSNKILSIKNIILIIILSVIQTIFYNVEYNIIYIVTNFLAINLFSKIIFKENMSKTILSTTIAFLILMLADFINSIIMINFVSYEKIRSYWYIRIINNLLVFLIYTIIISIPKIKKKCEYFVLKSQGNYISTIVSFFILMIAIISVTYTMTDSFKWTPDYIANIFIVITLIIFCYIFIHENNQFNKLNDEYDSLFKCIQTFEDWIEREQLNRHEYKNQLAVLRCMTKDKKVKDKIDSIIADNINISSDRVNQLKPIPNGGLKGLLYYKMVIAQNNALNIEMDVSVQHPNLIKKIPEDEIKILCKLLGIYLDNAIEASKETKKKILLIEIYELNKAINIVISNTFNKNKNIGKRNEKGYTTKGTGHGNGLYFAKKMIEKNEWLKEEQQIINNIYIQKLVIKK